MSLEALLEENTKATIALTEVLKSMTSGTAITAATTGTKASDKKDDKDEGEEKTTRTRRSSTKTDKAPTEAALKKVGTQFLDEVEGDEDAYSDRREEIARLAEKYNVKRLSECEEGDRADIIAALEKFAKENPAGGSKDDSGI